MVSKKWKRNFFFDANNSEAKFWSSGIWENRIDQFETTIFYFLFYDRVWLKM